MRTFVHPVYGIHGSNANNSQRFSSFVESHAHPLLDLSLYVTSQNYYTNTSPSYAHILQWPNQWIFPPKLHSAAKARIEHLGVSSLDLQAIDEQRKRDHSAAVAAGQIPQNFIQRPRDTVSGLLGKTAQQNQFRLDALTEEVFEPLEEILGEKRYLLSNSSKSGSGGACTLDCLATGYLSLMLVPDLAYPWLRDAMNAKAPQLAAYTERMRQRCFGSSPAPGPAPTDPTTTTTQQNPLPWRAAPRANLYQISSTLLSSLADAVPVVRDLRNHNRLRAAAEAADSGLSGVEQRALSQYATGQKKDVVLSAVMVVGGVAALVAYMIRVGLISVDIDTGGGDSEDGDESAGEGAVDVEELDMKATDFLGV